MALYPKLIMEALATVTYAGTKKNLVESGMVADTPVVAPLNPPQEGKNWSVKVVLEFVNNSDTDFKGVDGMIYKGTKFYLVGSVKPQPVEANADDYKKRVFTQDYTTTLSMTVQSLAKAYRVLPNLLQPRLEIGVQLTTQWVQAEPQNVILE